MDIDGWMDRWMNKLDMYTQQHALLEKENDIHKY